MSLISYISFIIFFCVVYCEEQYCSIDNVEDCTIKKETNNYKKGTYKHNVQKL